MPEPATDQWIGQYLLDRDQERAQRREAALAKLTEREQRLVREFAVMGFVHGQLIAREGEFPKDSAIMAWVIDGLLSDTGRAFPVFRAIAGIDDEAVNDA